MKPQPQKIFRGIVVQKPRQVTTSSGGGGGGGGALRLCFLIGFV